MEGLVLNIFKLSQFTNPQSARKLPRRMGGETIPSKNRYFLYALL